MTLTRPQVRDLLAANDISPSKSLGQNFVVDPNTVRRIARLAGVGSGDQVLEIGAGLGSLTLALAETGARVTALETDRRLVIEKAPSYGIVGKEVGVAYRIEEDPEKVIRTIIATRELGMPR